MSLLPVTFQWESIIKEAATGKYAGNGTERSRTIFTLLPNLFLPVYEAGNGYFYPENTYKKMNAESIREYVLMKPEVEEGFPFGENTLVFKTGGKLFLLLSLTADPVQFNVKCEPDKAVEWRETYPESVLPGYHMNKKHWNTILLDGVVSSSLIQTFIDDSYALVRKKK